PQYGCAQVSMNLTDLDVTPLHVAFDTCDERARDRGLRVTGSEIVGLLPKSVLLDSGRHYLRRMGRPTGVPESALIHTAIRTLGLSEVKPFDPKERVIEYRLAPASRLASMTVRDSVASLPSECPGRGGGWGTAAGGHPPCRGDRARFRRRAGQRIAGAGRRFGSRSGRFHGSRSGRN